MLSLYTDLEHLMLSMMTPSAELLKSYAKRDLKSLSQNWNVRDAVAVSGLHDTVELFSSGFASLALCANPVTGLDEASPLSLSLSESNRIKRAFYRFELFYNIFRKLGISRRARATRGHPQSLFFSACAPWENEQLTCVRDYRADRVSLRMCS